MRLNGFQFKEFVSFVKGQWRWLMLMEKDFRFIMQWMR